MFAGCLYQTNVYVVFQTHKWRKHTPQKINDLKARIVSGPIDYPVVKLFERNSPEQSDDALPSEEISAELSDLTKVIELKLASVLPVIQRIIAGYLQDSNCGVN